MLLELADLSFSTARFVKDFDTEKNSVFEYNFTNEMAINSLTYSFSLNRPNARGGAENITLNILLSNDLFKLVNQFIDQFAEKIHNLHERLDKELEHTSAVQELGKLRVFILAYEEIYGTRELISNEI